MGSCDTESEANGFACQERDPRIMRRRKANPKDSPARSAIPGSRDAESEANGFAS
jgi:hypothetical protein